MPADLHVVIPTHLPRYLDLVLVGLARQTVRPATIVVSCDTDDPAIGGVIDAWAPRLGLSVWWVRRPHTGEARLNQVRNNGARHLVDELGVRTGRILLLDGDMLLRDDVLAGHAELAARADMVCAYRINLSRQETSALDPERVLRGEQAPPVSRAARAGLAKRGRRYRKQLLLGRLRLGPIHKPKVLGGHFHAPVEVWRRINGFDEAYLGWGFEDDDFTSRACRSGARRVVAVRRLVAWHLWHETRQSPGPMTDLPNWRRFADLRRRPLAAELGLRTPMAQPAVAADRLGA